MYAVSIHRQNYIIIKKTKMDKNVQKGAQGLRLTWTYHHCIVVFKCFDRNTSMIKRFQIMGGFVCISVFVDLR